MRIKDIMCREVAVIAPDLTVQEAAQLMRSEDVGCLPVVAGGRMIGMVTDRDIVCRAVADGLNPLTTPVDQVMSPGVACCYDDQELEDVAHLMEDRHIRRLPVLDHDSGQPVGFLSLGDLSGCCPPELLREIMGGVAVHH